MVLPLRCFVVFIKRYIFSYIFVAICCGLLMGMALVKFTDLGYRIDCLDLLFNSTKTKTTTLQTPIYLSPERLKQILINKNKNLISREFGNGTDLRQKWLKERIERLSKKFQKSKSYHIMINDSVNINYNVHVFYYAWYENEMYDGRWQHWNHEYLSNWKREDVRIYPTGHHDPPNDIGSNFYPALGCYSSKDPNIIDTHMNQIKDAGIGVLVVSWYPPGYSDGPSESSDTVFSLLLDSAERHNLKIAPHVEPYKNRNPINFLTHLKYFANKYGDHPALYKIRKGSRNLPVYYIYDSYLTPATAWRELLGAKGNLSVRGTSEDGIFLGLLVEMQHRYDVKKAHFDGFYTYFASNGFTYGSSWKNWRSLAKYARQSNLIFIPSIGPGYIDTRVRPWNTANTRHRRHGKYYEVGWRSATSAGAEIVTITSFNEWHEGTQIEPAVPKSTSTFTYLDYEPESPNFYLNLTKSWVHEFGKKGKSR